MPDFLPNYANIAGLLDHAILHPTATDAAIDAEVNALKVHPMASFCVKPYSVKRVAELIAGSATRAVCTVIGFPSGSHPWSIKAAETRQAFDDGATEVDMVVNVGKALSHDWAYVRDDIEAVTDVAHGRRGLVKVIFETDFLPDDAVKIRLCEICTDVGVDFVKTSTGFGYVKMSDGKMGYRGATEHDIELMRKHSGPKVGIKPSGGIRTLDDVLKLVPLGATRIGTGSAAAILNEAMKRYGGGPGQAAQGDGSGY